MYFTDRLIGPEMHIFLIFSQLLLIYNNISHLYLSVLLLPFHWSCVLFFLAAVLAAIFGE